MSKTSHLYVPPPFPFKLLLCHFQNITKSHDSIKKASCSLIYKRFLVGTSAKICHKWNYHITFICTFVDQGL